MTEPPYTQHFNDARIRVRYAETDQMGVVYHANYIIWFEVGRVELMRSLGFEYKVMEAEDIHIAVVDVQARYRHPARYDDDLLIRTRLKTMRGFLIKYSYEVLRESDSKLLCEGETTHIICNSAMQKMTMPEKYAVRFRALGIDA